MRPGWATILSSCYLHHQTVDCCLQLGMKLMKMKDGVKYNLLEWDSKDDQYKRINFLKVFNSFVEFLSPCPK